MRWSLKSILNTSRSSLLEPGDERFLDGVRAAQVTEATPGASLAIVLMMVVVVVTLLWASAARAKAALC